MRALPISWRVEVLKPSEFLAKIKDLFCTSTEYMKKERWTESEVRSFPTEHDQFERKSGRLVRDDNEFRESLAKALSAMANSHGGHLVLWCENDGRIDGVPSVI